MDESVNKTATKNESHALLVVVSEATNSMGVLSNNEINNTHRGGYYEVIWRLNGGTAASKGKS